MGTIQEFDFSVDCLQAMLWQYNVAPNLLSIVTQKQDWYDINQEQFWLDWYANVFNLDTANDFGLSVWAIILDIPIIIATNPTNPLTPGLFFDDLHANFTHGNFGSTGYGAIQLTTEQARTVLKMRYYQITSNGTVTDTNRFLSILFKDNGLAYVRDNLDMTATYVFAFALPSGLKLIFNNYDLLPRPAGVKINYIVESETPFGFDQYNENFDQGNFLE